MNINFFIYQYYIVHRISILEKTISIFNAITIKCFNIWGTIFKYTYNVSDFKMWIWSVKYFIYYYRICIFSKYIGLPCDMMYRDVPWEPIYHLYYTENVWFKSTLNLKQPLLCIAISATSVEYWYFVIAAVLK